MFSIATGGEYPDAVEMAAVKLAKLGDKRVYTDFDTIARQGSFARGGDYNYNEKLVKFIELAVNVPCEEAVIFLQKHYKGRNSDYFAYQAFCAQRSLHVILKKVQGTPLAEQIEAIDLIHVPVSYSAY